ncbi:MAG TPA: hypothetical protein VEY51_10890 [Chondromyces sp.]|nr:hypothetical protein [Chondromyces sp.]
MDIKKRIIVKRDMLVIQSQLLQVDQMLMDDKVYSKEAAATDLIRVINFMDECQIELTEENERDGHP